MLLGHSINLKQESVRNKNTHVPKYQKCILTAFELETITTAILENRRIQFTSQDAAVAILIVLPLSMVCKGSLLHPSYVTDWSITMTSVSYSALTWLSSVGRPTNIINCLRRTMKFTSLLLIITETVQLY